MEKTLTPQMSSVKQNRRLVQWDLLRSIAMFLVIVCHSSSVLDNIEGGDWALVGTFALICDPIFFFLSGYFASKQLKGSYLKYVIKKVIELGLPLVIYSIILYLYDNPTGSWYIAGWLESFASRLQSSWWFIPSLLPKLLLAPFVYMGLSKFLKNQQQLFFRVLILFNAWAVLLSSLSWAANMLDIKTLIFGFEILDKIVPIQLIGGYSLYFVCGMLYKFVAPTITTKQKRFFYVLGFAALILDLLYAHFGVTRNDPSYFWLFETLAVFSAFESVSINSHKISNAIVWCGKRSYSIYLLNATMESFVLSIAYGSAAIAAPNTRVVSGVLVYVAVWFMFVVLMWFACLVLASVIDPLLIESSKRLLLKAFHVPKRR